MLININVLQLASELPILAINFRKILHKSVLIYDIAKQKKKKNKQVYSASGVAKKSCTNCN